MFVKKVHFSIYGRIGNYRFFLSCLLSLFIHAFVYWVIVSSHLGKEEVFRALDVLGEPQGKNVKVRTYKVQPEKKKHEVVRKFSTQLETYKKKKAQKKTETLASMPTNKTTYKRDNTLNPALDRFFPSSSPNFLNKVRKSTLDKKSDIILNASKGTRIKNAKIKNHLKSLKSLPLLETPLYAFEKEFNEKFHKVWGPIRYGPKNSTFNAVVGEFIIFDVYIDKKTGTLLQVVNISEQNDPYRDYNDINTIFNSVIKDMFPYPLSSHLVKYIDDKDNAIILSIYIRIV